MVLVELQEVTKIYQMGTTSVPALRGVSLKVESGEFVALVGPSGCGKTTLLNILGFLDQPTKGTFFYRGHNMSRQTDNQEADQRLAEIGFIFQSFNLVPVLSVAENIEVPLVLAGVSKQIRKEKVRSLLESVGIADLARRRPEELSGGQRQRVAIARALVNEPSLILADEPTANLDTENGALVMKNLSLLNRERGVTIFLTTHNPELLRYASRILHLRDGLLLDSEV